MHLFQFVIFTFTFSGLLNSLLIELLNVLDQLGVGLFDTLKLGHGFMQLLLQSLGLLNPMISLVGALLNALTGLIFESFHMLRVHPRLLLHLLLLTLHLFFQNRSLLFKFSVYISHFLNFFLQMLFSLSESFQIGKHILIILSEFLSKCVFLLQNLLQILTFLRR